MAESIYKVIIETTGFRNTPFEVCRIKVCLTSTYRTVEEVYNTAGYAMMEEVEDGKIIHVFWNKPILDSLDPVTIAEIREKLPGFAPYKAGPTVIEYELDPAKAVIWYPFAKFPLEKNGKVRM